MKRSSSALMIGLLALAGCGHSRHLSASGQFTLEAVQDQGASTGCTDGAVPLTGGPGDCYRPSDSPLTITKADVGPIITDALGVNGLDGFWLVLPSADTSELHTLLTAR